MVQDENQHNWHKVGQCINSDVENAEHILMMEEVLLDSALVKSAQCIAKIKNDQHDKQVTFLSAELVS